MFDAKCKEHHGAHISSVKLFDIRRSCPSKFTTPPLKLIVHARIKKTRRRDFPISLITLLSPLACPFGNPSYGLIYSVSGTSSFEKVIRFNPHFQLCRRGNNDLGAVTTVPSLNSGKVLTIEHEVERHLIDEAGVEVGERFRLKTTDKGLTAAWWGYDEMSGNVNRKCIENWKVTNVKEEVMNGVEMVLANDGIAEFEIVQEDSGDTTQPRGHSSDDITKFDDLHICIS